MLKSINLHWSLKEIGGTYGADGESPANGGNPGTAAHFHHAQRHTARLFRRLERRNLQMRCTGCTNRDCLPTISQTRRRRASALTRTLHHGAQQRMIQLLSVRINTRRAPITAMHHDRVGKSMMSTIGGRIWKVRCLQKTQTQDAMLGAAAKLAVIKHCHPKPGLGHVHPIVPGNLKLRTLPRSVVMGSAFDMAKLNSERRPPRTHRTWEQRTQQFLLLVPLNVSDNIDARTASQQAVALHQATGTSQRTLHGDLCGERRTLRHRDSLSSAHHAHRLLLIITIGVPRFPATRTIFIDHQLIHRQRRAVRISAVCDTIALDATKFTDSPCVINRYGDHSIAKGALAVHVHCIARIQLRRACGVDHLDSKRRHTNCQHIAFLGCQRPALRRGGGIEYHQLLSLRR